MTTPLELKPCPFCGGEAESDSARNYRNISTGTPEKAAAIYCTKCSADMTWCYRDTPEIERDQVMTLLIEQWNTRATPSLEGDAVERVARIISRAMLDNPTGDTSEERAAKRKAIATEYAAAYVADLATGLVAGEAAIRADEREKCAKVADEHSFGRDIDWWLRATKKDVSAETCRSIAAAIRSGGTNER